MMSTRIVELEKENQEAKENKERLARALQEKDSAEQTALLEKSARQSAEREVEALRAQVVELQRRELNPGAFARVLMKKIRQTKDFGVLMAEMGTASTGLGLHTALVNVQSEYPQMSKPRIKKGTNIELYYRT